MRCSSQGRQAQQACSWVLGLHRQFSLTRSPTWPESAACCAIQCCLLLFLQNLPVVAGSTTPQDANKWKAASPWLVRRLWAFEYVSITYLQWTPRYQQPQVSSRPEEARAAGWGWMKWQAAAGMLGLALPCPHNSNTLPASGSCSCSTRKQLKHPLLTAGGAGSSTSGAASSGPPACRHRYVGAAWGCNRNEQTLADSACGGLAGRGPVSPPTLWEAACTRLQVPTRAALTTAGRWHSPGSRWAAAARCTWRRRSDHLSSLRPARPAK